MFGFVENCQTLLNGCTIWHSHQQWTRVLLLHLRLVVSVFGGFITLKKIVVVSHFSLLWDNSIIVYYVEHLFHILICDLSIFGEVSVNLLPFFLKWIVCYCLKSFLCILDNSLFFSYVFCEYLSQSIACLFIFCSIFWSVKFFNFFEIIKKFLIDLVFDVIYKSSWLNPRSWRFSMFTFRWWSILPLILSDFLISRIGLEILLLPFSDQFFYTVANSS